MQFILNSWVYQQEGVHGSTWEYIMRKTNKLKLGKITVLEPTEEKRKEILNVIESMMMDYINRKPEEKEENKVD